MNYTVNNEKAIKRTITITRDQMWNNFLESWSDIVSSEPSFHFKDEKFIGKMILALRDYPLDCRIRDLFRDGYTYMLMGDAMQHIDDPGNDILAEIVVVDGNAKVVVKHEDINY